MLENKTLKGCEVRKSKFNFVLARIIILNYYATRGKFNCKQLAALSFIHLLTKHFIYFQDCQSGRKKGKPHGGKPVSV
jgi:hypothetical protein